MIGRAPRSYLYYSMLRIGLVDDSVSPVKALVRTHDDLAVMERIESSEIIVLPLILFQNILYYYLSLIINPPIEICVKTRSLFCGNSVCRCRFVKGKEGIQSKNQHTLCFTMISHCKPILLHPTSTSSTMESSFCREKDQRQPCFRSKSLRNTTTTTTTTTTTNNNNTATRRRRTTEWSCDGTRRTRRSSFPNIQWSTQQIVLLSCLVLSVLLCNDSSRIAEAFPLRHSSIRHSNSFLPIVSGLSPKDTRRQTIAITVQQQFQEILGGRRTRRKHHEQLFSASASSASLDGEGGDKTSSKNNNNPKKEPVRYRWTSQTLALALPALIGMLADPLLSMMDTAYVGNLGSSTELAALGACTSIFHLAFNAFRATTAATTSLVGNAETEVEKREIIRISLSLGLVMGVVVGTFLRVLGPWCLAAMGVHGKSPLFTPALSYLRTRSLAAPAVLAITVAEGAFRGYGNTRIPLLASATAALVNLVLDPILMLPPLSRGVQGAAAATAAAQAGALCVYLWFLRKRKMLPQPAKVDESTNSDASTNTKKAAKTGRVIKTILGANLAMVCKQGSLLLAWAYATAKATRIGQAHVAAHQVALSCWLVFALLQDGAGVASQVLLTRVLSNKNKNNENVDDASANSDNSHEKLVSLVKYMLKVAVVQGLVVTGGFLLVTPYLPGWFVPDDAIVRGHLTRLLPHVAGQQLLVSLTLVLESLAVGGKQFKTLAAGTALSTILSVTQIQSATTVVGVWSKGIVGLFVGRLLTAMIGTWKVLRESRRRRDTEAMNTNSNSKQKHDGGGK
jgi:putative MATE family efflux protein